MAERAGDAAASGGRVPICFVVDEDGSIRHFLSLIVHGAGIDTEEFADGKAMAQTIAKRSPDLVFLNIGLESSEAIETILMLAKRGYFGFVQLMSGRGSAVLEHVKSVGLQHKLQMLPVLKKPFETTAIVRIMQELKLGHPVAIAARIGLDEALKNGWVEFWYQPKIDLRKSSSPAPKPSPARAIRIRHPVARRIHAGRDRKELIRLSELALVTALKTAPSFAALGINLRFAVNIPVRALVKLSIGAIVARIVRSRQLAGPRPRRHRGADRRRSRPRRGHGQAARACNVQLAIDDFGRAYSSLARLKELPFAELKLDRSFVADCATDPVNAPMCETVIELAQSRLRGRRRRHRDGADALALTSMGCDMGQGFLFGQPMPEERFMSLLRQRAAGQGRAAAAAAAAAR